MTGYCVGIFFNTRQGWWKAAFLINFVAKIGDKGCGLWWDWLWSNSTTVRFNRNATNLTQTTALMGSQLASGGLLYLCCFNLCFHAVYLSCSYFKLSQCFTTQYCGVLKEVSWRVRSCTGPFILKAEHVHMQQPVFSGSPSIKPVDTYSFWSEAPFSALFHKALRHSVDL